jgi:glucosamine--fructose-6-phosphate aminotransferase (isomerizing)
MAPHDELFDKTVSNMQEVMARGGQVLLDHRPRGRQRAGPGRVGDADPPDVAPLWAPILYAVPRSSWPTTRPSPRAPTWTSPATSRSP